MRIVHIISSLGVFGAESVLLNIISALENNKDEPYLICLKNKNKLEPKIYTRAKEAGVPVKIISCINRFDVGAISLIVKFIKKRQIEVIHTHNYKSNMYGVIAAKFAKVPVVCTLHGWVAENSKVRFYEFIDRLIIRRMDHIVTVSPAIRKDIEISGINPKKITYIPNAVDVNRFSCSHKSSDLRQKLGLKNSLVVGAIGRLVPEKGHKYLLKAFKGISSAVPAAKLLMVGDGYLKDDLMAQAQNLGISDKVVFVGIQDDIVSVYEAIDVLVLSSLTEGLPLVILEAMSMKVPVVASAVGSIPYIINNGEGILVEPKNIEELERAMFVALHDKALGRRMGEKAREKVTTNFSLEIFSQNYINLYKRIAGGNLKIK